MNPFGSIDDLGDVEINGGATEHVGVVSAQFLFGDEEVDRLANGDFRGLGEVFVDAHGDVMRRRLGPGPSQVQILANDELKDAYERRFECRDVNLAITLTRVAVADFEEAAGDMNGNEERGSGDELFVVEVARMDARRCAD